MTEPLYQIGICPDCPAEVEQRFLFARENRYGPIVESGRIVAYSQVDTLSLFQCERCKGNLLYLSEPEQPFDISIEQLNLWEPDEIAEVDPTTFLEISTLLWPQRLKTNLPTFIPEAVRKAYHEALVVKKVSPASFAVQVGRALEGIQRDLGIPGRALEQLESHSPQGLAQLALRIKKLRNLAAHAGTDEVTPEQATDIDEFFRLIIEYVYVLPHNLARAREKIELVVDASDQHTVH